MNPEMQTSKVILTMIRRRCRQNVHDSNADVAQPRRQFIEDNAERAQPGMSNIHDGGLLHNQTSASLLRRVRNRARAVICYRSMVRLRRAGWQAEVVFPAQSESDSRHSQT